MARLDEYKPTNIRKPWYDKDWFEQLTNEINEKYGQYLEGSSTNCRQAYQLDFPMRKGEKVTYTDAALTHIYKIIYVMQEKKLFGINLDSGEVTIFSIDPITETFSKWTSTDYKVAHSLVYRDGYIYAAVLKVADSHGIIIKVKSDLSTSSEIYDFGVAGTAEMDSTSDGTNLYICFQHGDGSKLIKVKPDDTYTELSLGHGNSIESISWDGSYLWLYTNHPDPDQFRLQKIDVNLMTYTDYIVSGPEVSPGFNVLDLGRYVLIPIIGDIYMLDKDNQTAVEIEIPLVSAPTFSAMFMGHIWLTTNTSPANVICVDPFTWSTSVYELESGENTGTCLASDGRVIFIGLLDRVIQANPCYLGVEKIGPGLLDQTATLRKGVTPTKASDTTQHSADTEKICSTNYPSWEKLKGIKINETLQYARVTADAYLSGGMIFAYLRLYRNEEYIIGTQISFYNSSYETKSWDFTDLATAGNTIQLYGCKQVNDLYVKNFRIKYDIDIERDSTVTLD